MRKDFSLKREGTEDVLTYLDICNRLKAAGIEEYRREAGLLISHFCGVAREMLPFCRDRDFNETGLIAAVKCRERRYPLQYIFGEWQFCTETYFVGPGCLIPRSETEQMVIDAVSDLKEGALFADLCTGSGCIAVSVLVRRPDVRAVAVDISPEALRYAIKNAERYGVSDRIEFITADILENEAPLRIANGRKFDAILSNPPYIPKREIAELEPELSFEPKNALDGGEDGLVFYRSVTERYGEVLSDDGFILYEIGSGQSADIVEIGEKNGFSSKISFDISGHDRNIMLRKRK